MAFTLSFEAPAGKARRRSPANRADFETVVFRLNADRWSSEPAKATARTAVAPKVQKFHDALINALAVASTRPGETTKAAWQSEAERMGLIEPEPSEKETATAKGRRTANLRKAQSDLITAGWIGVDGERVMVLSQPQNPS